MSTIRLTIPHSLEAQVEALATREGVSVDTFVALALAEKVAALSTEAYIAARAARGSREGLLAVLAKAPDAEPEPADRL